MIRRIGRASLLLAGAGALVLGPSVLPAMAASPRATIDVPGSVDLNVGGQASFDATVHIPDLSAVLGPRAVVLHFSLAGSGGKPNVVLALPPGCDASPDNLQYHCEWDNPAPGDKVVHVGVTTPQGEKRPLGDLLSLVLITDYDQSTTVDKSFPINVHDGGTVAVTTGDAHRNVQPGVTFTEPMGFQNVSGGTLSKVDLFVENGYGVEPTARYSNCRYGTADTTRNVALCEFTVNAPAEASYEVAGGFGLHATSDVPDYQIEGAYGFYPPGQVPTSLGNISGLTPGQGPALTLARTTATAPNRFFTGAGLHFTGDGQTSSVAPQGAQVGYEPGRPTAVPLAVVNHGAAAISINDDGGAGLPLAWVAFPKGVAVTAVPQGCLPGGHFIGASNWPANLKAPDGGTTYDCFGPKVFVWKPGQAQQLGFTVTVGDDYAGGKGVIAAVAGRDGYPTADITFAKGGVTTPAAGGGTSAQPGHGSQLAETGGSSSAPMMLGIGAALVAAAGAAFVVARRRRAA